MSGTFITGIVGLLFVLFFAGLVGIFTLTGRKRPPRRVRHIPAFEHLNRAVGLAVEAGKRLHISLGRGNLVSTQGPAALMGLNVLQRIARLASISDRPPVSTSGEGSLGLLSQETLRSVYQAANMPSLYDPNAGQVSGLTPFSYAAGTLPVIFDEQVSASLLFGHFGSEAALIADASERAGSITLAGSDNLAGQAVMFAAVDDPLIGEELFAAGAYVQANPVHAASLRAEDILRWVIVAAVLTGAVLKGLGLL